MFSALPAVRMTLKSILMSFCPHSHLKKSKLLEPSLSSPNYRFENFLVWFWHKDWHKSQNFPNPKSCCGISKICTLPPIKAAFALLDSATLKKMLLDGLNIYEKSKFA